MPHFAFFDLTLQFDQKEETILRVSLWALFKKQKWLKIAIVLNTIIK
jgi:hypothetical protein